MAKPDQHESIGKVIEQLETAGPGQTGWTTQVYHLRRSDPRAAQQALVELLPAAEIAFDFRGRNLLVTASAEDHRTVQQVVEQMDQTTQENRAVAAYLPHRERRSGGRLRGPADALP